MKNLIGLLLTALALTGCWAPVVECGADVEDGENAEGYMCADMLTNRFAVSDKFTPEQREAIEAAARGWRVGTWGLAQVSFETVPDKYAAIFPSNNMGEVKVAEFVKHMSGIRIRDTAMPGEIRCGVARALGHAFGLSDSEDPTALMFPASQLDTPTESDLAAFRRLWNNRK